MSERRSMPPLPAQQLNPRNAAVSGGSSSAPRNTVGSGATNPTDVGQARLNMPYRLYSGPGITATYAGTGVALRLDLTTVEPGDSIIAEDRWVPVWDESSLETRKLPLLGGGTVMPHIHPESDIINLIPDLAKKLEDAPKDGLAYARSMGIWQSIVVETIAWDDVVGKPSTFPPTLPIPSSGVTGLDAKQLAQDSAIDLKEDKANKGVTNGYASLDSGGKVPAAQLPSYVDDIVEYPNLAAFPPTGETGKIYVALDTNQLYRWTGSVYVEVSAGNIDVYTRGESDARYVNVTGDTLTGFLTLHAPPTAALHASTKQYVDTKVGGVVAVADAPPASPSPGQFWLESDSGTLFVFWQDPNSSQWVDVSGSSALDNYLPLAGGTMTGPLTLSGAPTALLHAATKKYVDDANAGQDANVTANYASLTYVNTNLALKANLSGAAFTSAITVAGSIAATGEIQANSGILRLNAAQDRYLFWTGSAYTLGGAGNIWHTGNFNPASYAPIGGVGGAFVTGTFTATGGNYAVNAISPGIGGVLGYDPGNGAYGFVGYSGGYGLYTPFHFKVDGATCIMGGLPTTAGAASMHVSNPEGNRLYRYNSSVKNKTQIEPIEDEYGDKILDLKPVFFRSLNAADDPTWSWFGFTAEGVDEVDFRFCVYTKKQATNDNGEPLFEQRPMPKVQEDGTIVHEPRNFAPIYTDELVPDAWNVNAVVAALVQLVQRQEKRIQALEAASAV